MSASCLLAYICVVKYPAVAFMSLSLLLLQECKCLRTGKPRRMSCLL